MSQGFLELPVNEIQQEKGVHATSEHGPRLLLPAPMANRRFPVLWDGTVVHGSTTKPGPEGPVDIYGKEGQQLLLQESAHEPSWRVRWGMF